MDMIGWMGSFAHLLKKTPVVDIEHLNPCSARRSRKMPVEPDVENNPDPRLLRFLEVSFTRMLSV
jgi:hypothetical protein